MSRGEAETDQLRARLESQLDRWAFVWLWAGEEFRKLGLDEGDCRLPKNVSKSQDIMWMGFLRTWPSRLLEQLSDLEKDRADLGEEEYSEMRQDTLEQVYYSYQG